MNICNKCGYKVISNAMFEKHMATHVVDLPVRPPVDEPVVFHANEITLRFTKPVEVYINGKAYLGKEIIVKDMALASEIVRIAREAYGSSILV